MKNIIILSLLALIVSSCGLIVPDGKIDLPGFEERLVTMTKQDVDNALKLAVSQQDTVGILCWTSVNSVIAEIEQFKGEQGIALYLQKLRADSRGRSTMVQMRETCKPVLDSVTEGVIATAARLGMKAAPIPK